MAVPYSTMTIFVNFYSPFTICEIIIPDNYFLQVLFLLTYGTSLKVGIMLWKQMTHRCNNVHWLIVYLFIAQCLLVRHHN